MNWTRLVSRLERLAERAHQQRLRDAGHALEQHVAAGEQRDDQAGDGAVLADHGLADLGAHARRGAGAQPGGVGRMAPGEGAGNAVPVVTSVMHPFFRSGPVVGGR